MTANRHRMKLTGMVTAILAAAIGFGTLPSTAEGDAFGKMDSNADGYITSDEIGGDGGLVIEILDTDSDGRVSPAEFKAARLVELESGEGVAFKAGDESTDDEGRLVKREVFVVRGDDGVMPEVEGRDLNVWIDHDSEYDTVDVRGEDGGKKIITIKKKVKTESKSEPETQE